MIGSRCIRIISDHRSPSSPQFIFPYKKAPEPLPGSVTEGNLLPSFFGYIALVSDFLNSLPIIMKDSASM